MLKTSIKNTKLFSDNMGERGIVEADHIPPKNSVKLARDQKSQMKNLQQKNPKLYDMINSIESDQNGRYLLTMRVLKQHHRNALTTGRSKTSDICRKLLADTLASGDVEKSLKLSFIMAHPIASDQLRDKAGTLFYYKAGFNQMLNHHSKEGIIDQNQQARLKSWVSDKKYMDPDTPEYNDILAAIQ